MKLNLSGKWNLILLVIICILTVILYSGCLNYPVLSNDDVDFFTKYPEILNLSWKSTGQYFSGYYVTLYQPLTVLTFAINYAFTGASPLPLHLGNLLFHLLNILLVFIFFHKLLKNSVLAILIAFLFAIHPMNVETVVWISARSSSMYTCFYLLSLIAYLKYIHNRKSLVLVMVFAFFILSLFCKVQAVTLPFVLLLLDYFYGRKISLKLLLEKLPFILLSIAFLLIAVMNTETSSSIRHSNLRSFTALDLVFLNGRAIFFYLQKFLVPAGLTAIYAFPSRSGSGLPLEYYLDTVFVVILLVLLFRFRKNKTILLGAGIFLFGISINLPLVSARSVIFADRYAYLPYLGLLLIPASCFQTFFETRTNQHKSLFYGLLLLVLAAGVFFSFSTLEQTKKWENDLTLSTDILQKNPPVPLMAKIFRKRGNYYSAHRMFPEAIRDYSSAVELNPEDVDSYIHRAYANIKQNRLQEALPDLDKGIDFRPGNSALYAIRAMVKLNNRDGIGAWADCNKCLSLDSTNAEAHNFLAILKFQSGDLTGAERDLRTAIRYNDQYAEAYKNLGIVYFKLNDPDKACYYWGMAARLGDRQAMLFQKTNCLRK